MAKYKVLYTDTGMEDINIERNVLEKGDAELLMASATDEECLICEGKDCDGIMVEYAAITSRVLDAWGKVGRVRVVGRQGIGFDNIDIEAATRNNIMVANVPDYCLDEVADHTMALALNILREIKSFGKRIEKHDFSEHSTKPILRLKNKNFCIYGFGSIGKKVAKRARAFGFAVYAHDPFVSENEMRLYHVEKVASIAELAALADVFTIHVPLIESTKHAIHLGIFKRMKSNCVLVNTARGEVIDEKDLIQALNENLIAGAGLDVFEQEPPDLTNPLLYMDNVVVTPHISWCSSEAENELRTRISENILATLIEGRPRNFVNSECFNKMECNKPSILKGCQQKEEKCLKE